MKILLDIPDNKASSLMDVLRNISYVKAKPLSSFKAKVFEDIKEAVKELNLIKAGKLKGIPAKDLLNEL